MDNPVRDGGAVRMTTPATRRLEPGRYVYEFDVRGGTGTFQVVAGGGAQTKMTCDTDDGTVGRKLRFQVKP
jgi:hypothetical protein